MVDALFVAVERGTPAEVSRLIESGADLDARLDYLGDHGPYFRGLTPLMVACMVPGGRAEVVEALLEAGADPFAVSEGEVSALWYSAGAGIWQKPVDQTGDESLDWSRKPGDFAQRLRRILEAGGHATETARNGRSALGEACAAGDPERVRMLLEAGAIPIPNAELVAQTRRESQAFLKEMAEEGASKLPISKWLKREVQQRMLDLLKGIDSADSFQIPLHQAAEGGSAECVRLILTTGFPADYRDNQRRIALFFASTEEAARALLEAGSDAKSTDVYHRTALEAAYEEERYEVATVLLRSFGDVDRFEGSWTQLHKAAFRLQPKAVGALVEAGANPLLRTLDGDTALHLAAWQGDYTCDEERNEAIRETIRLLVGYGLDPNGLSQKGLRPLHEAVHGDWGSVPAVEELLRLGADPNGRDKNDRTPLMEAADNGELGCIEALLAGGADRGLRDHSGNTALHYAKKHLRIWQGIVGGKKLFRRKVEDYEVKVLEYALECVKLLGGANPA